MAIKIQASLMEITPKGVCRINGNNTGIPEWPPKRVAVKITPAVAWVRPEPMVSWYLNSHCSCGCRLSTDNKDVWCSSIFHEWHESKASFMANIKQENKNGAVYMRRFV
jgi:hypothetical protein